MHRPAQIFSRHPSKGLGCATPSKFKDNGMIDPSDYVDRLVQQVVSPMANNKAIKETTTNPVVLGSLR